MTLLDTSVLMALVYGDPVQRVGREALEAASAVNRLFVSAVSAWELGLLATRTGRTGPRLGDARSFFNEVVARARLQVVPLTAEIAFEAAYLPGEFHRDPSDRMIVAGARVANLTLLTADRRILAYAALGHVRAIRC